MSGALGVAMAIHAHLQQKMDNIAVMKSLGAASRDVIKDLRHSDSDYARGRWAELPAMLVRKAMGQAFPLSDCARFFQMDFKTGWNHQIAAVQGALPSAF